MNHPFLRDLNVADLIAKKIIAPFKPKLPDFNEMVRNTNVGIKDLNETTVPEKNKKILSSLETEFFSEFGTNIDFSSRETLVLKKAFADDQDSKSRERARMAVEEETKPEPKSKLQAKAK
jgi:hypothetical protein